ncbi:MAG: GTPase HflX [Planctomycetota bacterium]|nr:GTPase HflX [Planctomycetota bacterium]
MAKHSFDSSLHKLPSADDREIAVVLKAVMPGDPSINVGSVDPVAEIMALADTAGLRVESSVLQKRDRPHPGTYVGRGKLEELKEEAKRIGAHVILVDDPISPGQGRNIEEATELRVVDRAELIMDIFARNARSHQAKIQVELAQLQYFQSRLTRMWTHLSRMEGGAVGTRGPGETQLESDRRIISKKISFLRARLSEIEKQARVQHKSREGSFRIALVGYTNAGKSTMLRRLTGADVLVEDRLFSTLDTSTRRWELDVPFDVLLSDTVGFIRKLPHGLVASFHATLMEAREADLLLHIIDASSLTVEFDIESVERTLKRIDCENHRTLMVFNKLDQVPDEQRIDLQHLLAAHDDSYTVSAAEGTGIDLLIESIIEIAEQRVEKGKYQLPHSRADLAAKLHTLASVELEEFREEGIFLEARFEAGQKARWENALREAGLLPPVSS